MGKKYALIDTNVWTNLIEQNGKQLLEILERLVKNGELTVLLPDVIKREWSNVYPTYLPKEHSKPSRTDSDHLVRAITDNALQSALDLVSRIEILFESCTAIAASNEVKIQTMDRFAARLAPFHKNSKSNNDCIIYYSTIEWCLENRIGEFFFVSLNANDFSDPDDKNKLHPQLTVSGIDTIYLTNLAPLLKAIDEYCFETFTIVRSSYAPIILPNLANTQQSILEKWEQTHKYYFSNLTRIPRYLLSHLYPYVSRDVEPIGYSNRVLYINNPELVSFLEGIKADNDGVILTAGGTLDGLDKEAADKLRPILTHLNQNLVTELRRFRPEKKFAFIGDALPECECVRCSLKRLDLLRVTELLQPSPGNDLQENLRQGYVRYLFYDFFLSAQFFHKAYQQAGKEKLHVIQLIAVQNLQTCANRIKGGYIDGSIEKQFGKLHYEDADLIFSGNLQRDKFISEASKLVYRNYFNANRDGQISELHGEVSKHYQSQLRGGYSSNDHIDNLMVTFNELKIFVENNAIVSDRATEELKDAYELVLDAYIMSHNFNEQQGSRIAAFSDFFLGEMVYYSRPETLRKILAKNKFGRLRYKYPEDNVSEFVNLAKKLLKDFSQIVTFKTAEGDYHHYGSFAQMACGYLTNVLLLCAVVSFSDEDDIEIAEHFVAMFEQQGDDSDFYREVQGGLTLLWRKRHAFNDELLTRIVTTLMSRDEWARKDWMESVGELLSNNKSPILKQNMELSAKVYTVITESAKKEDYADKRTHIINWHGALHQHHQAKITETVTE